MAEIFRSTGYITLRIFGAAHTTTALTLIPVAAIGPKAHAAFNVYTTDPEAPRHRLLPECREVTSIQEQGGLHWFDFSANRVNVCHFKGGDSCVCPVVCLLPSLF
jgi:hypothetical protein